MDEGMRPDGASRSHVQTVKIEITWTSIFRVFLGIVLAVAVVTLWTLIQLLMLAILIAVALYPMVRWVERRRWPRWIGIATTSILLLSSSIGFLAFLGPMLVKQSATALENLPQFKTELLSHLPQHGPANRLANEALSNATLSRAKPLVAKIVDFSKTALIGVFNFGLILVMAIYLMIDGPRLLKWLIVFFPARHRPKISEALAETSGLIEAYLMGQFITSVLAGVYVFAILTFLHVPMALLLGVVAGVFDVLPIIGFFLAVLPAMAVGLTVSSSTGLAVFVLYAVYHLFENYFIVPKVYGNKLELSTLAVLLAVMAAAELAGVMGAIVVLPIVAAYPAIERLFLTDKFAPDTVRKHEQMQETKG